jgi:hypothetical protein
VLTFPTAYRGDYYYADYCGGWIRRIDPSTSSDAGLRSGISFPVDLKVGPDGAPLLSVSRRRARGADQLRAAEPPSITLQPADRMVPVGQPATFTVSAIGSAPLAYRWRRNGNLITGATGTSYTLANAQLGDSGALFDVVVSNALGSATSDTALLTVTQNSAPAAAITQPVAGTTYAGGSVINYAGTGNDLEDGVLPASAFTWWVDLHHDSHTHPRMPKDERIEEWVVHHPDLGRDLGQRLLPVPPGGHGLGRAHTVGEPGHPAAQVDGHARNESSRSAAAPRRPAGDRSV